jgi:hypothetical protein
MLNCRTVDFAVRKRFDNNLRQPPLRTGLVAGKPAVRPLAASYRRAPIRERGKR